MQTFKTRCIQLEGDHRGVVTIWLDSPERTVNVFDEEMLADLAKTLDYLESNREPIRIVLFRSRKPHHFFAGADVTRIAAIEDPEELRQILVRGHELFGRIERLADRRGSRREPPLITVAVIEGACMGGGLEFALACRLRIASNDRATKLGLPEIQLGVIPGWGGTQRLPQLIGQSVALPMILEGKSLDSRQAMSVGLIDRIIGNTSARDSLPGFVDEILGGAIPKRHVSWKSWLLDRNPIGRWGVRQFIQSRVARQARHYPAINEAIRAVAASSQGSVQGYGVEQACFGRLLFTPECRSLLRLFLAREHARRPATWVSAASSPERIEHVAILGAGAMGAGIGLLAAMKGYQVVLKELDEGTAEQGRRRINEMLRDLVQKGKLTADDRSGIAAKIRVDASWEGVAEADLVIEAVVEKLAVKEQVFEALDKLTSHHAILTSNTSSLSVTAMGRATHRPHQIAGLHFFNPVHRMDLVEIVKTDQTSATTLGQLVSFVKSLGKTPVVTADSPGFLVNRVLFPYLAEGIRMVCAGYDPRKIDREMREFGMPMGPLELLDQVGLDVAWHVAKSLPNEDGVNDTAPRLLDCLVQGGDLGKKSASVHSETTGDHRGRNKLARISMLTRGFYEYRDGKKLGVSPRIAEHVRGLMHGHAGDGDPLLAVDFFTDGLTLIQRRLVYSLLNESVKCLDENVVAEAWMVDLAMVLGTGYAPFRGGPLSTIDQMGAEKVFSNMQLLHRSLGERFRPASGLPARRAREGNCRAPARASGSGDELKSETLHERTRQT
jgi:3-hydroxyacyl-CoA dehydrogenase/enoyl-CoA hydratase/3-hydroxybutyryl-CoA epimerase